jgi:dynein heavy chain
MKDNSVATMYLFSSIICLTFSCFVQVGDLQYASPSTISRAGIVYVDPNDIGYKPYWQRWIETRRIEEEKENLKKLFDNYIPSLLSKISGSLFGIQEGSPLKTAIPQTPLNMVCPQVGNKNNSNKKNYYYSEQI